jgi:hypothetical protein
MSDTNWQDLCVGRDKEKQVLRDTWQQVKEGKPGFIVLRGESGFGKTRIVQDFYTWLSQSSNEDPHNYWPDALSNVKDSLKINPLPDEFGANCDIPYLWWGIRWSNPDDRNQIEGATSGLLNALDHLNPHQQALEQKEKEFGRGKELASLMASLIANPLTFGAIDTFNNLKKTIEIRKEEKEAQFQQTKSLAQRQEDEVRKQLDLLFSFMTSVLNQKKKLVSSIPIVIVLDDAHWMDTFSLEFISQLFEKSIENSWPLMVISTHWEREWYENQYGTLQDNKLNNLANIFKQINEKQTNEKQTNENQTFYTKILDFDKVNELEIVINSALPGLTTKQVDFLLESADGNPLLMQQIIQELIEEPFYFENEDVNNKISEEAVEDLNSRKFDLHSVQKRRFQKLDKTLQQLLSYASYHGLSFLPDFVLDVARQIDKTNTSQYHSFEKCITPYVILARPSAGVLEFRNKVYYDIANERIRKFPLLNKNYTQCLMTIAQIWIENKKYSPYSEKEQRYLFIQLINLIDEFKSYNCSTFFSIYTNLAILDYKNGYFIDLNKWTEKLIALFEDSPEDALKNINIKSQIGLVGIFKEQNLSTYGIKLGLRIKKKFLKELSKLNHNTHSCTHVLKVLVNINIKLGDIYELNGDLTKALECYQQLELINYLDPIVCTKTIPIFMNIIESRIKAAEILQHKNKFKASLEAYLEIKIFIESIAMEAKEPIEYLHYLWFLNSKISEQFDQLGKLDECLVALQQASNIATRLENEFDEGLRGYESTLFEWNIKRLSNLDSNSTSSFLLINKHLQPSYHSIDKFKQKRNTVESNYFIQRLFKETFAGEFDYTELYKKASRKLFKTHGETSENIKLVYDYIVGAALLPGAEIDLDLDIALTHYKIALKYCRILVNKFGNRQQYIEDNIFILGQITTILYCQEKHKEALSYSFIALDASKQLNSLFGESLRNLYTQIICEGKTSELLYLNDDNLRALDIFEQSVKTCRRYLNNYGDSREISKIKLHFYNRTLHLKQLTKGHFL